MQKLIDMALNDEFDIASEAMWALGNATQNKEPHSISYLVQIGFFQVLTKMMNVSDIKILMVALEGLKNILETGATHFQAYDGENQLAV
jgi:hypothetical protein